MDYFDKNIDELLAKHLAGECSPEEEETISKWLAASPENKRQLADLVWLWQRAGNGLTAPPRVVNTEAALRQTRNRLRQTGRNVFLGLHTGIWLRAAAALVLALGAVYFWQQNAGPEPIQIAATETILTDTLTDGSVVTLGQHSGISLSAGFNRRERRMRLNGQAFFQVTPDTNRPFVVEVEALEVQVVGTAFTVDEKSTPDKVIVTVDAGTVRVSLKAQQLLLQAGEQATFDRSTGKLSRTIPQQGSPVFKNRVFRFDATPLRSVVAQIEKSYGVRIFLKNKQLEKCPLTASYNNLPLERVLQLVSESFSFELEKVEGGYLLLGTACEEN